MCRFVCTNRFTRTLLSLLIVTGLFLVARPATLAAQTTTGNATVFEGARLIIGDGSIIEDSVFVVDGPLFSYVGKAGQARIPAGARRVDLRGKTVMPAIIDTHTHLSTNRDMLIDQLQRKAYYGVGVAMSLGQDTGDVAFQVRAETIPNAARFRTAGRGLTMPEPGRTEAPYWVKTAAEARQAVRELAARQVDLVKIWVDDRNGTVQKMTPEIYTAVIDEAHAHGLRVTAHILYLADATDLLNVGLDASAHGVRDKDIDDVFVNAVLQRPAFVLVPNLPDPGVARDLSWLADSVPAAELQKLQAESTNRPAAQQAFGIQARNLAKLNSLGVRIALGTDGSVSWAHHLEMEDMVTAGMRPSEVIVASTKDAAVLLKLADVGVVAAGKTADFLVLDANPLDDIKNTRRINSVYLRGSMVDRAALRSRWMSQNQRSSNGN